MRSFITMISLIQEFDYVICLDFRHTMPFNEVCVSLHLLCLFMSLNYFNLTNNTTIEHEENSKSHC